MKIVTRIFGLSIILILSYMIAMEFTGYYVRRNELNTCIKTAMTSTQIIMQENIEDEYFGTENARKVIDSNEAYVEEFGNNFYVLPTTNTDYHIDILAVDYTKGLLHVKITGTFTMLNGQQKSFSAEKTSIIDVLEDAQNQKGEDSDGTNS